jgi:flagellar FliL protein
MADQAATQAAPEPAKKKSKKGLLIGIVGLLVVGGGGAAYWFTRPTAEAAEAGEAAEPEGESVVSFEPFVVNLADAGGGRYLRVNVQLVLAGADASTEVEEDAVMKVRLRSDVLALLTEQTSDALMTTEGKTKLKEAISERASHSIEPHKVRDVLFSDFIVQR